MGEFAHWFVAEVWPNIVASVIWATPAFTINHVLLRRHITRTAQHSPQATKETTP